MLNVFDLHLNLSDLTFNTTASLMFKVLCSFLQAF